MATYSKAQLEAIAYEPLNRKKKPLKVVFGVSDGNLFYKELQANKYAKAKKLKVYQITKGDKKGHDTLVKQRKEKMEAHTKKKEKMEAHTKKTEKPNSDDDAPENSQSQN